MCAGVCVNMININKLRNWFSSILFLPTGMKYSTHTYVRHKKLLIAVLSQFSIACVSDKRKSVVPHFIFHGLFISSSSDSFSRC